MTVRYVKPNFPEDVFTGTAAYYAECRLPYPEALINDLLGRAGVSGEGRALDLACGPGRIALPLASSCGEVWAIDLEPEMIEVGRSQAEKRGVNNIKWFVGRAEELEAEPSSFQLIAIGEAFHRLDQEIIARQALRWLSPGGSLAIMGWGSLIRGNAPWQKIVADITHNWESRTASTRTDADTERPGSGPEHNRLVLEDFGFEDVGSHEFPHTRERTIESIIGWLFSTSRFSKRVWGENATAFEEEIRSALLEHGDGAFYVEDVQCGYTLGRKPS